MKVFLTAYGGGHITAILPAYEALTRRGHECVLLALTTAGEVAARANIPHLRPIDFVPSDDVLVQSAGRRLAERHHTDGKGLTLDESIAYLGVSFRELADDVGEEEAWSRYSALGLNAFTPTRFMRGILEKISPEVVVATTSPRMEKAALRAAFQLDIPSLCMIELFGLLEEPWLSRPDNGHVLAVSRPDVARRMIAAGRQAEDIHLIGNPMFDYLANPDLTGAGRAWRQRHGLRPEERLVFWAEQPEPPAPELPRMARFHLAEICRRHGWRLAIRLHPSSTDPRGEIIPDGCLHSPPHEPIAHVISACDVGVTLTSTVGWELLLADKPLLVMRISAYSSAVTYGDGDGALAVDRLEDSERGLEQLLSDSPTARAMAEMRRRLPKAGGASERVCDLLENVVLPRQYSLERYRKER